MVLPGVVRWLNTNHMRQARDASVKLDFLAMEQHVQIFFLCGTAFHTTRALHMHELQAYV